MIDSAREKFITSECKYGAEYYGANWNNQGYRAEKVYLSTNNYENENSLCEQIEVAKFIHQEAVYGDIKYGVK